MSNSLRTDISSDFQLELNIILQTCEMINTPRSLAVFMILSNHEWQQYMDLSINASDYETASNFADDYLVTECLRKSPNIPLGVDRAEVALRTFLESEDRCGCTNERIPNEYISFEILRMRNFISRVLGPLDRKALDKIEASFSHGPGATTGNKGRGNVLSNKFDDASHLTIELIPFVKQIMGTSWHAHNEHFQVVPGNKFTTVPKSAKTDRGICIEPLINVYCQLGVGAYLKSRLKRFGVDLTTQKNNRDLAKVAYEKGLATIDLAAASDSLATSVVELLLPKDWVALLDLLRSKKTTLPDGTLHLNEKFSSMGNGYTFELESLIFSAIIFACVPPESNSQCSVYGDDIIVPQKFAPKVIDTLEFLGFRVNEQKSFLAGNFFESCGADYFKGIPVRPYYMRGAGIIPYSLQLANRIRVYSSLRSNHGYCDLRFKPIWDSVVKQIPGFWAKHKVPLLLGDCGLIVPIEESTGHRRPHSGLEGFIVRGILIKTKTRESRSYGFMLSAMNKLGSCNSLTTIANYDATYRSHHDFRKVDAVPTWTDSIVSPNLFSYNREVVRGLFGKPRTKSFLVNWKDGLSWEPS